MIRRVRSRLVIVAALFALVAALILPVAVSTTAVTVTDPDAVSFFALAVFGAALLGGLIAVEMMRRRLRDLVQATHQVARDTTRRVPVDEAAPSSDELRELGAWVNFLAEDA